VSSDFGAFWRCRPGRFDGRTSKYARSNTTLVCDLIFLSGTPLRKMEVPLGPATKLHPKSELTLVTLLSKVRGYLSTPYLCLRDPLRDRIVMLLYPVYRADLISKNY
jgi:hypothetical protein